MSDIVFTVVFNKNEYEVLLQLIDQAIRSNGLSSAKAGAILSDKIALAYEQAVRASQSVNKTPKEAEMPKPKEEEKKVEKLEKRKKK